MNVEKIIITYVVDGVEYQTEVLPDFDKTLAPELFERVERNAKLYALKQKQPEGGKQ